MTDRQCGSCGRSFEAASPRARFCGNTCRSRAHRAAGGKQPEAAPGTSNVRALPSAAGQPDPAGLVASIERQLRDAGRLDTWQGQGALELAERMASGRDTGSAISSLHRELRAAMSEALRGVGDAESAVTKHRNQLAERRAARAARA